MKLPGLFVPLDVKYARDEAIRRAGWKAELLFLRGLAYAKDAGTDGFVPDFDIDVVGSGLPFVAEAVAALVHWELWAEEDGGWRIPSWRRWNPADDTDEADHKREQARERKRRQRDRQAQQRAERANAERGVDEEADETPAGPGPGQLKLVASDGEDTDVTRDVTRDSHGVTPPSKSKSKSKSETHTADGRESAQGEHEPGSDEDPLFVAFWEAYPRKVAKKAARKAWAAAMKRGADPGQILDAARLYASDPRRQAAELRYTAHASTWLNQERYADEAEPPPAHAAGGSTWRGGGAHADTPTHDDFNQRRAKVDL